MTFFHIKPIKAIVEGTTNISNINLTEKTKPIVPKKWGKIQTATLSFGHGLSISPIQMIEASSKLFNNNLDYKTQIHKKNREDTIKKTKFLARINQNGQIFYIGSNGKFIKNDFSNNQLPFIFGSPTVDEFFRIKKIIDETKISYIEIKNLYFFPSKRWDLELRDDTIIKLPHDNVNIALNLAIEFLDDNKFIDARIENQIILDD